MVSGLVYSRSYSWNDTEEDRGLYQALSSCRGVILAKRRKVSQSVRRRRSITDVPVGWRYAQFAGSATCQLIIFIPGSPLDYC